MASFKDLGDLEEDKRIEQIGRRAMNGLKVAFVTDDQSDDPDKAGRYINKLLAKFPKLEVVNRFKGPVPNTESVIVQLKRQFCGDVI